MTTAISIIQDALEAIGEYAPGESITDADAERSLAALNDMLDQWSNENLACFAFLTQSHALVQGQRDYTIGPSLSADVNGVRPLRIEQAYMLDNLDNTYPIEILTLNDWNLISNRGVTSQIPTYVYYDPQNPIATLKVFPVPTMPLYTLYWTSYLQLEAFTGLYNDLSFPKGYVGALKANLAVKICKYFGRTAPPDLVAEANETRGTMKRKNSINQPSRFDREIVARSPSTFNIISGGYSNLQ